MTKFIKTKIEGLYTIEPEPFEDKRGKFFRVFCKDEFNKIGHLKEIVQINQSYTKNRGTIRGMHFQYPPKAEIKIVKCTSGSVFDVAIDLRRNSSTFLKWHSDVLSSENMKMMYIPEGFAHGFQTLENNCELIYFHTEFFNPKYEGGVNYYDPKVNIQWPLDITGISENDKKISFLNENFKGIDI